MDIKIKTKTESETIDDGANYLNRMTVKSVDFDLMVISALVSASGQEEHNLIRKSK